MRSIWFRARAELRARWPAVVALTLLIGTGTGLAAGLGAGARRTDTAYPRFLTAQRAFDVFVATDQGEELLHAVAGLPQVTQAVMSEDYDVEGGRFENLGASSSADPRLGETFNRLKILEGRRADPRRPDEAVVSFRAAERFGLVVDQRVRLGFARPAPEGEKAPRRQIDLKIVGIESSPGEFPPELAVGPTAHLTPAFHKRYARGLAAVPGVMLRLRRGADDIPAFTRSLQRLGGGEQGAYLFFQRDQSANVQRSFHLQAVALWIVAGLIGLTVALVTAQLLARQAFLDAADHQTLRALGMGRRDLFGLGLVRTVPVALGAAVLATAVTFALSPFFPFGLVRKAEPHAGLSTDWPVVLLGALVTAVVVLGSSAWAAWRLADARLQQRISGSARPSRVAAIVARAPLGPTPALGMRMALDAGRGHRAVPIRSSLAGAAIAVAALSGALTFGAGLHDLLSTPLLYGWNWDAHFEGNMATVSKKLIPMLVADHRVEAVAGSSSGVSLTVGRHRADLIVFDRVKGTIHPVVLEGRTPTRRGEVLLGTVTMRKFGVGVGDRIEVALTGISPRPRPVRVVGRGVLPPTTESGRLGEGALMPAAAVLDLVPPGLFEGDSGDFDSGVVRFAPGTNTTAVVAELRRASGVDFTGAEKPSDLVNFGRVQQLPFVAAGVLAILGVAVLAHVLATSIRRRRYDLAVLKSLGLGPRQVRAIIAWQATTLAVVALLVGVPLGTLGGRWGWRLITDQLGLTPELVVPWVSLLVVVLGIVVTANLVAALPGWLAARIRPAVVLRDE